MQPVSSSTHKPTIFDRARARVDALSKKPVEPITQEQIDALKERTPFERALAKISEGLPPYYSSGGG